MLKCYNKNDIEQEPVSFLKKKRKTNVLKDEEEKESDSILSNKNNEENQNLITFPQKSKNNIYNTFSSKIGQILTKNTKIYTTSTKKKYNYFCQEINSKGNSIVVNDAKILILENQTLLFLLSSNSLYLYEIQNNKS